MLSVNRIAATIIAPFLAGLAVLAVLAGPALAVAPEAPDVTVQEPIHATTATFLGVLNPVENQEPNNRGGVYKFFYREGAVCKGAGGHETKPSGLAFGNVHEEPVETVTGLTPDTTYTVCLQVTNLEGETALSAEVSFKTAMAPEEPVTGPATSVTPNSEEVKGTLNPHSTTKVGGYFAYSNPGGSSCLEGPTARLEGFEGEKEEEAIAVHTTIGGLEPHKTYKACLVASDELGDTTHGTAVSFTTAPAPPRIDGENTSAVKSTEATLEAQINPNNQATSYVFEYSATEAAGALTGTIVKVDGASALEGGSDQTASVLTGALTAGTTYYYRVVAENAQSKIEAKPAEGGVRSFTTVPVPTTEAVTAITASTATFHGHLKPLNEKVPTKYDFNYKLGNECANENATFTGNAGTAMGTEEGESANVTGLQPNHEYTVCFVTRNEFGSEEGTPVHFTTPVVTLRIDSETVSNVTPVEATLEAQVNPNNQKTTYKFEYATSPALTSATTLPGTALEGFGDQTASASTGAVLQPGETYYYRIVVENTENHELVDGAVQSFTPQGSPLVTIGAAQDVTSSTAILSGTINPAGTETTYHFAYAPASAYQPGAANPYAKGKTTPQSPSIGSDYTVHATGPIPIAELQPNTTYDYALVASNTQEITTISANQTFTTGPAPIQPPTTEQIPTEAGQLPASPFTSTPTPAFIPYTSIATLDATEAHENKTTITKKTKTKKKKKKPKKHKKNKHHKKK
jgi:hypothetical protein